MSRFSIADLKREVLVRGLVASIGDTTIWRWLSQDAIRPWRFRSWIFPRDPDFSQKASRILDLYEGIWEAGCSTTARRIAGSGVRNASRRPGPRSSSSTLPCTPAG